MAICSRCGQENPGGARFCNACAAPLEAAAPRVLRRTVTVLFCDITGSTALGESTDPETVRALLARYFERMKGIVEAHGGTVEKFIGDAVMAVFGIPRVHEDDALRACRAAVEMRDALPELGVEARIGVNTGEVVTGTLERLATGDPVNVAARLEQAAQPGQVVIGEGTLALIQAAVDVKPLGALALKGKTQPVPAYRLLAVHETVERRRHEARFVGRIDELESLWQVWHRALEDERCELVTVIGDAGVGKSRLAAEFLAGIEARAVRGRCLSYGQGITYWPVVEVLKQLHTLPSDPSAASSIRSLLRETDEGTSTGEIAWAFRTLLEEQARKQPLVCLFDDIQWGEETFLDLVEQVASLSSEAPILVLCLARPELTERRPRWPTPLRLEPLAEDEVAALIPEIVPDDLRARISHAAGGNPLFVTEFVALAQQTDGELAMPPTLQAVLAARLDQLGSPERSVLERGAVEGEVFHRGAVQALAPDEAQLGTRLLELGARGLILPDAPQLVGEEAFRFRHLLLRDVAYEGLAKTVRAELHERFADWLEDGDRDIVELDELLGYHLEQAARWKQELGQPDPELAERAGERLAAGGRRALFGQGDAPAATVLLERGLALTRPTRFDAGLELDLAQAVGLTTDIGSAVDHANAAAQRAQEVGDETGESVARVVAAHLGQLATGLGIDEVESAARAVLPRLEEAHDDASLARVWGTLATVLASRGKMEEQAQAAERAIDHARAASTFTSSTSSLFGLLGALCEGPRPADDALRTLDRTVSETPPPAERLQRAKLLAMLGRFDEAWPAAQEAYKRQLQLGGFAREDVLAEIAALDGDHVAAADYLRQYCERLEARGEGSFLSTSAPAYGRELCALGRYDEAEPLAHLGRKLGDERDFATQSLWRRVQALIYADRGQHAEAEALIREAIAILEQTDCLKDQGDTFCDLAEVLVAAGRTDEAATALERALERYERKKNLAMVAQVRPRLEELRAGVT